MERATLRLFKAIQTENDERTKRSDTFTQECVRNGFVVDPRVKLTNDRINTIKEIVGISGEKANSSFHKSWSVIENTPQEALWLQAIVHYVTTYGYENLGIYSEETVYIPNEKLEIPDIKDGVCLNVVKAMNKKQILNAIIRLGGSGIALSQETLNDIMTIVRGNGYSKTFVKKIKNRELLALLNEHFGLTPSDPVEFLRYVIAKLCDETLLIKNRFLIGKIKESSGVTLDNLMKDAPKDLASIFFRFKPIFLAMKSISKDKSFYNRLRKQANSMHVPVELSYLDQITSEIKNGTLNITRLHGNLIGASIFRKIRLAYALKSRFNPGDSIVYKIRNGKSWVDDFEWASSSDKILDETFGLVYNYIVSDLTQRIKGKTVYIPEGIVYAIPATEKQFTGEYPTGSYVSVPHDMVVGIHWTNTDRRIDLDLSMVNAGGKLGWNSYYRNDGYMYSGDMTNAPKPYGATELFYCKKNVGDPMLLTVNYFNYYKDSPVPSKIFVGSEKIRNTSRKYMIDQNNILASPNIVIDKKQTILGMVARVDGENRFYISQVNIGGGNVSYASDRTIQTLEFMKKNLINSLSLNDLILDSGAKIVHEIPEDEDFIDLSPSVLDKNTIINLLVGEN